MSRIKVSNGFFPTVEEMLDEKQFYLAEQHIIEIDQTTKRIENKYFLHHDAIDSKGNRIRARKDKFTLSRYLKFSSGHKLLFLDENNKHHLAWARAQGKNATWVVSKNFGVPKEVNIMIFDEMAKINYNGLNLPCCVTTVGPYNYVTQGNIDNLGLRTLH